MMDWTGRRISFVVLLLAAVPFPVLADDFWTPPVPFPVASWGGDLSESETGDGLTSVFVTAANEDPETVAEPVEAIRELPCGCQICGGANQPAPGCKTCCHGRLIDWSKYPATIHPMPRPGIFPIPPTGPGYYSAWDQLTGQCRPAQPKSGYAPFAINAWPFFDADWRYVEGIPFEDRTIVEKFKRLHCNDCMMLSIGGEFWTRYSNEPNSRLRNVNNDYTLAHVRQYADLWYSDFLRVYGEYIWADSFGAELPPVPPDVARGDVLNLFVT